MHLERRSSRRPEVAQGALEDNVSRVYIVAVPLQTVVLSRAERAEGTQVHSSMGRVDVSSEIAGVDSLEGTLVAPARLMSFVDVEKQPTSLLGLELTQVTHEIVHPRPRTVGSTQRRDSFDCAWR